MKKIFQLFTFAFIFVSASAAVPLHWTVETSRATPAQFEAYQGETLALEAALMSYGKPLEAPVNYSLYWQTNGMGNAWWTKNCTQSSTSTSNLNLMVATWSPTNDVGAKVYNCFIGKPGTIYHAAFQLRLRPSPGATPNELPLPQKVIDFAKVTVLNPPWSGGGGGGGVDTNAVIDIVHKTVDGAARPLPKFLHALDFADSYTNDAAAYYRSRGNGKVDGGCSSVRDGGFLFRNFDFPFDERAEFVVKMSAGNDRFASVGVAQVGTNLTEQMVTSGKWSKWYKALPGATVDGINENGVACNINVVDGDPQTSGWHTTGDLNPLAAIRWILDNATNAEHAARYIAANIRFPSGWTQNFHYMIADELGTWIVENGMANGYGTAKAVMTNFILDPPGQGAGYERYELLFSGSNITNAWFTNAYRRETNPPWVSDLAEVIAYTNEIFDAWTAHPKEYFRNKTTNGHPWWQTVHTSIYDITNRVLRVAVQETDDWYTDKLTKPDEDLEPSSGHFLISDGNGGTYVDYIATFDRFDTMVTDITMLENGKANKVSGATAGNLASLDENGDLADSGKKPSDFRETTDNTCHKSQLGNVWICNPPLPEGYEIKKAFDSGEEFDWIPVLNGSMAGEPKLDVDNTKTNLSWAANEWQGGYAFTATRTTVVAKSGEPFVTEGAISTNNPAFSNAVDTIVRSLMPTTLRAYDPVRQCWWNIQPVNGVLTLTVED